VGGGVRGGFSIDNFKNKKKGSRYILTKVIKKLFYS
jgi:hypothetical protein